MNYKRLWKEMPGAMGLIHFALVGGSIVIGLLTTVPLAGLIGLLVFLLILVALIPIAQIVDGL